MIPIMITAMLLVEAFIMPYLLCSLDFVTAAVLASILASISMGICYFVIKQLRDLIQRLAIEGCQPFLQRLMPGGGHFFDCDAVLLLHKLHAVVFKDTQRIQQRLGNPNALAVAPFLNGCVHSDASFYQQYIQSINKSQ